MNWSSFKEIPGVSWTKNLAAHAIDEYFDGGLALNSYIKCSLPIMDPEIYIEMENYYDPSYDYDAFDWTGFQECSALYADCFRNLAKRYVLDVWPENHPIVEKLANIALTDSYDDEWLELLDNVFFKRFIKATKPNGLLHDRFMQLSSGHCKSAFWETDFGFFYANSICERLIDY